MIYRKWLDWDWLAKYSKLIIVFELIWAYRLIMLKTNDKEINW